MDDALPAAEKVLRSKLTFDLIWLSAVWMHVPPGARAQAFRKLVSVMSPGGSMMQTLRQGPPPADRPMEPATAADVEALARRHGLQTVRSERVPDFLGRDGIAWEVIWLRLPDDGTGALALRDAAKCIRHMPATYTTYPGSSDPIFPCARRPVRIRDSVRVDEAFLWSFGTFSALGATGESKWEVAA